MNLGKSILLVGLLIATSSTAVFAQTGKLRKAKSAIAKFEELKAAGTAELGMSSLTEAQEAIDDAIAHDKTKENPETWTYYALVYANLANLDGGEEAANKADEAIKKATELDTDEEHSENINVAGQTL